MHATIVVPCFDEARRLRPEAFEAFAARVPGVAFLFVDDGSRDGTRERLADLVRRDPERFALLDLPENRGKGEAVRAGIRAARPDAGLLGYWDADLSTPLDEIPRFAAELEAHPRCDLVLGSRVLLLGRNLERSALRHYAGRVFATCASLALGLAVYDTQCGAKLFRDTPEMRGLFAAPFLSRWCFDVELIARLAAARRARGGTPAAEAIRELPLRTWRDVPGSKVGALDLPRALVDLWRIRRRYGGASHPGAG